jgi:hypothetical protein
MSTTLTYLLLPSAIVKYRKVQPRRLTMRLMKYVIQFWCMASEIFLLAAIIFAVYFFMQSVASWPIVLLIIVLAVRSFRENGFFFAWRPVNIRSFFKNMRANGL